MTVWAVGMVKDEADIIAGTLNHLADEVDGILLADNGSTDDTRKILDTLKLHIPLVIVDDPEVGYRQSEKMSALAALAGTTYEATWILPFDADEIWFFQGDRITVELDRCDVDVVRADLFNHFPSAVDPAGDDPFTTIVWRQPLPAPLPKVAFRWRAGAVIAQGNHTVRMPGKPRTKRGLEIRHFPYRTPEQFVRKARNGAAAYAATDLPYDVGQHWRQYGELLDRFGEEALHDVYREYFWFLSPSDAGLIRNPAPYLRWR